VYIIDSIINVRKNILKRIFGSKIEDVIGSWRKLHNEEQHHISYLLPNTVRVTKLNRVI
jgi:hypothetical protein